MLSYNTRRKILQTTQGTEFFIFSTKIKHGMFICVPKIFKDGKLLRSFQENFHNFYNSWNNSGYFHPIGLLSIGHENWKACSPICQQLKYDLDGFWNINAKYAILQVVVCNYQFSESLQKKINYFMLKENYLNFLNVTGLWYLDFRRHYRTESS